MPCPLTSSASYPEYLQKLLQSIEFGNNDTLKGCACSLRTPLGDDGCPILDQDGKLGAFPFCINDEPPETINCNFLDMPYSAPFNKVYIPLTLKQLMTLFWRVKSFTINFGARHLSEAIMGRTNVTDQKELVCQSNLNFGAVSDSYYTPPRFDSNGNPIPQRYDSESISINLNLGNSIYRIGQTFYIKNFELGYSFTTFLGRTNYSYTTITAMQNNNLNGDSVSYYDPFAEQSFNYAPAGCNLWSIDSGGTPMNGQNLRISEIESLAIPFSTWTSKKITTRNPPERQDTKEWNSKSAPSIRAQYYA